MAGTAHAEVEQLWIGGHGGKGDPGMRDRGTAEKLGGKVQSKVGDVKKVFGK